MYFETQKLSVGYHRRPLIEDIDIGIWQGGILCLIGPNGSGKSTILRSITRHLTKLGGVVAIGGRDLDGMSDKELARHVSVVLTDRIEPELMTCWEVVAAGRYPYTNHFGKLSREDQRIVEDSMARVNALELREQRFTELSDGQKQRVLLARALCQQPEVIVLDEPTSYLDIRHKIELLDILREMTASPTLTAPRRASTPPAQAIRAKPRLLTMFTSGLSRPAQICAFTDVAHSAPFIWSNRANSSSCWW